MNPLKILGFRYKNLYFVYILHDFRVITLIETILLSIVSFILYLMF